MATKHTFTDRLIDDKSLAYLLGLSPGTPNALRSRGAPLPIPFIRVGNRIRYRMSEVEKYLEKQTVRPAGSTNVA